MKEWNVVVDDYGQMKEDCSEHTTLGLSCARDLMTFASRWNVDGGSMIFSTRWCSSHQFTYSYFVIHMMVSEQYNCQIRESTFHKVLNKHHWQCHLEAMVLAYPKSRFVVKSNFSDWKYL